MRFVVAGYGSRGDVEPGAAVAREFLWLWLDQPLWAAAVQQLEVGMARRFFDTNAQTLVADLQLLARPQYAVRARAIASLMTKPAESRAKAADLVEEAAIGGA